MYCNFGFPKLAFSNYLCIRLLIRRVPYNRRDNSNFTNRESITLDVALTVENNGAIKYITVPIK